MDKRREVDPLRVPLLDELDLPLPPPSLDALLRRDRVERIVEGLGIDEREHLVLEHELGPASLAMLDDALAQAVRDADIKGPRRLLARHARLRPSWVMPSTSAAALRAALKANSSRRHNSSITGSASIRPSLRPAFAIKLRAPSTPYFRSTSFASFRLV